MRDERLPAAGHARRDFLRGAFTAAATHLLLGCAARERTADTRGDTLTIAAAANLLYAAEALNARFRETAAGVRPTLTTGASGSLYAQIQHGAPIDVFLSADTDYPARLAASGAADRETLRTFATGRLVLWTTLAELEVSDLRHALEDPRVKKIAIAQPQTAPYGRAAEAVLTQLGLLERVREKFVVGENIAQTAQFVETGSAELGFVALSLVKAGRLAGRGRWVEVPAEHYASVPLAHAAVLTKRGAANPAARQYLTFLESEPAREVLRRFGYALP